MDWSIAHLALKGRLRRVWRGRGLVLVARRLSWLKGVFRILRGGRSFGRRLQKNDGFSNLDTRGKSHFNAAADCVAVHGRATHTSQVFNEELLPSELDFRMHGRYSRDLKKNSAGGICANQESAGWKRELSDDFPSVVHR